VLDRGGGDQGVGHVRATPPSEATGGLGDGSIYSDLGQRLQQRMDNRLATIGACEQLAAGDDGVNDSAGRRLQAAGATQVIDEDVRV
jgi:hypothetical protein